MSPEEWLELNIFKIGLDAGLDIGDGQARPSRGCIPLAVEPGVVEKIELAHEEAAMDRSLVEARHFAVALAHPSWTNKARMAFGLPTERRRLAAGRDRGRTFVPSRSLTAILCGGDTRVLAQALQIAPRPGLVMLSWWHDQFGDAREKEVRQVTKDAGLAPIVVLSSAPADRDLDAVANAGVVYLPGGFAEDAYGALVDTPLLQAISACVEAGGILVGNSAGAVVLGAGRLSRWESGDAPEPLPLLGWLDGLVVDAHVRDRALSDEARAALALFPGTGLLGVGQAAAVLVQTRPLRMTALSNDAGNESVLLHSVDGAPEVVQPATS